MTRPNFEGVKKRLDFGVRHLWLGESGVVRVYYDCVKEDGVGGHLKMESGEFFQDIAATTFSFIVRTLSSSAPTP